MNDESLKIHYQAGKDAFEHGKYRQSVEYLEKATELAIPGTRLHGEVQMWLVMGYQALGRQQDAIALCQQLTHHPTLSIRQESKNLLFILEAPPLKRPEEWMTKIPEFKGSSEGSQYMEVTGGSAKKREKPIIEPVDLSKVNTQDNQFIWVALFLVLLILGGLVWLSYI
jgi:hypothetical protein